jgi:hypothetical protein
VNRLTDDQTQGRIREESAAIERILRSVRQDGWIWVSSDILHEEIESSPLPGRKSKNRTLLTLASELIEIGDFVIERARHLQSAGYGAFDAMHLASAESAAVDVLLTTDDKFEKRASRGDGPPRVPVRNPVSWMREIQI